MTLSPRSTTLTALLFILMLSFSGFAQEANSQDRTLSPETRSAVIEAVLKALHDSYIFPDVAAQMERAVRARKERGEYDRITSSKMFAQKLTEHLNEVAKDRHLGVNFSYERLPENETKQEPTAEEKENFRRSVAAINFGFEKVERLNGNVGYMELNGFISPELGAETAIAAMQFLANTEALIIDLRYNGGGVPGLAQLISSYFFPGGPVHLHSVFWREGNRTQQFWTHAFVPGKRYVDKPVYVLLSKNSVSAPESFAYNLQALKRVTVVGETSAGAANPGKQFRVSDHFVVFIPTGRAINPTTGTNWEGVGVKPDIETSEKDALKAAHLAALRKLLETATSERRKRMLTGVIDEVEKQP